MDVWLHVCRAWRWLWGIRLHSPQRRIDVEEDLRRRSGRVPVRRTFRPDVRAAGQVRMRNGGLVGAYQDRRWESRQRRLRRLRER